MLIKTILRTIGYVSYVFPIYSNQLDTYNKKLIQFIRSENRQLLSEYRYKKFKDNHSLIQYYLEGQSLDTIVNIFSYSNDIIKEVILHRLSIALNSNQLPTFSEPEKLVIHNDRELYKSINSFFILREVTLSGE